MWLPNGSWNAKGLWGVQSEARPTCNFPYELRVPPTASQKDDLTLTRRHLATAQVLLALWPSIPRLFNRVSQCSWALHCLGDLALYGPVLKPLRDRFGPRTPARVECRQRISGLLNLALRKVSGSILRGCTEREQVFVEGIGLERWYRLACIGRSRLDSRLDLRRGFVTAPREPSAWPISCTRLNRVSSRGVTRHNWPNVSRLSCLSA